MLVVLVSCFAAVHCQDAQCIIDEVTGNPNLQTCAEMFVEQSGGNIDVNAFCGLPCLEDFRAVYDTCGFSSNTLTTCKSLYI